MFSEFPPKPAVETGIGVQEHEGGGGRQEGRAAHGQIHEWATARAVGTRALWPPVGCCPTEV